jgi:GMP synthase-like glutamine amidotransferase
MRIQCLQHVPFEGPAAIAHWAEARGHSLVSTPLYAGAAPPPQADFDWLLVMGGPMGIYDEADHPWLAVEKAFLRESISAGKTVVGVCLGAQLLADVLGARVYPGPHKEIGWFPIELTAEAAATAPLGLLPATLDVFHWHGDTFDLPPGAVHLASSAVCANQAFLYDGRVLGLQFHVESTPASVRDIVANCADELVPAPYIQSAERLLAAGEDDYRRLHAALFGVLDRLPA